ncbi:SH2 domain-containing adapter protein F-like isoform X2 [Glandiceps talaboti]
MAKLLKHFLGKKSPPQPPEPDYDAKNGRRSRSWDYESDEDALPPEFAGTLSATPIDYSSSPPQQQHDMCTATSNSKPRPHSYVGSFGHEHRHNNVGARGKECKQTPIKAKKPVIIEDYSDPFDLRKAAAEAMAERVYELPPDGVSERIYDEGDYTEPYEAQKMLQQIREAEKREALQKQKDGVSPSQKKVHVYEDPYDPEEEERLVAKQLMSEVANQPPINYGDKQLYKSVRHSEDDEHTRRPDSEQLRYSQSHEVDGRPPDEYDEPWDWGAKNRISRAILEKREEIASSSKTQTEHSEQVNGDSNGTCATSAQTREKDVRPVDEYEIPWDWKPKDRLSQVLLGNSQLNSPKKSDSPKKSHPPVDVVMTDQSPRSQSPKTVDSMKSTDSPRQSPKRAGLKLDIKPKMETLGETIDPTIPLEEQKWYHGKLSRQDAEQVLRQCEECSYLVRQSESGSAKDHSLSLKSTRGFMHMKIVKHEEGYILGEFSKPFSNIPKMIDFYTRNKLNIKGAEHMALLQPVPSLLL